MTTIHISAFQPFESRQGVDMVLALRFRFDRELIDTLKDALRQARRFGQNAGGWLPERRVWWVERWAWSSVKERLRRPGCTFIGSEGGEEKQREESHNGTPNNGAADTRA